MNNLFNTSPHHHNTSTHQQSRKIGMTDALGALVLATLINRGREPIFMARLFMAC